MPLPATALSRPSRRRDTGSCRQPQGEGCRRVHGYKDGSPRSVPPPVLTTVRDGGGRAPFRFLCFVFLVLLPHSRADCRGTSSALTGSADDGRSPSACRGGRSRSRGGGQASAAPPSRLLQKGGSSVPVRQRSSGVFSVLCAAEAAAALAAARVLRGQRSCLVLLLPGGTRVSIAAVRS